MLAPSVSSPAGLRHENNPRDGFAAAFAGVASAAFASVAAGTGSLTSARAVRVSGPMATPAASGDFPPLCLRHENSPRDGLAAGLAGVALVLTAASGGVCDCDAGACAGDACAGLAAALRSGGFVSAVRLVAAGSSVRGFVSPARMPPTLGRAGFGCEGGGAAVAAALAGGETGAAFATDALDGRAGCTASAAATFFGSAFGFAAIRLATIPLRAFVAVAAAFCAAGIFGAGGSAIRCAVSLSPAVASARR
jgi:hypothetical protein